MDEPHLASAEFGGFWIRLLALVVDSAVVFLVMALVIAGGAAALGPESVMLAALAAWLFALLYFPVMHASRRQASVGKALLGLRITGYQGNRISFLRALGRELAKILSSAVLMVGYILAAFTARKQALHDLVGSTYVIREGKPHFVGAIAAAVAGFVLPVVIVPLLVGGAMLSSMMAMVGSMEQAQQRPAMKPAPRPPVVAAAPKPQPAPMPEVPKPAPEVTKAPPPVSAPAPVAAPIPVAMAVPAPAPVIEPKKVEAKKPEPKKAVAQKTARKPVAPRPPATFEPKLAPGPKFNDLVTAVLYRDAGAVSELVKFGRWVDKPDSQGTTPLMLAVELGDAGSAEALLKGGADAGRALPVAEARRDGAMLDLLKRYASR